MPNATEEVLEYRFPSFLAWLLIGFTSVMFVLGVLMTTPLSKGRDIPVGLAIAGASVLGFVIGLYWLKHLPVMLRLKPEGLEVVFMKKTFLWADLQEVDLVAPNKHATFVCLSLRDEAKPRYDDVLGGLVYRAMQESCGDYDIFLSDKRIGMNLNAIQAELKKRIARDARYA